MRSQVGRGARQHTGEQSHGAAPAAELSTPNQDALAQIPASPDGGNDVAQPINARPAALAQRQLPSDIAGSPKELG
jgi:hypothetical protein